MVSLDKISTRLMLVLARVTAVVRSERSSTGQRSRYLSPFTAVTGEGGHVVYRLVNPWGPTDPS